MISLILPSYNEAENIDLATDRISEVMAETKEDYEIIFVNDGSKDGTYEKILARSEKDSRVKGISFSRNFGKEAAIFAGLEVCTGDAAVVLDCDMQHPPKVIPKMLKLWHEGYEVVEGVKSDRGKEGVFHRLAAGLFYDIMSKLIKIDMRSTSDYKLMDRKVIDVLCSLTERNTFFRALTFWVGFKTAKVEYEVEERQFGTTKWSFSSLMRYAINNATSFSTLPLEIVTFLGIFSILLSVVLGIETIVRYAMGNSEAGFPTVILLILLIGGFIMLSLGIIGHYIARIYEEVKGRPRYIIARHTKNIEGKF